MSVSGKPHDACTRYVRPGRPSRLRLFEGPFQCGRVSKWERWTDCFSVPYRERVLTRAPRCCAYNDGAGESWAYLGDPDPRLLSLFSSCDKDDEAIDFGH